MPEKFWIQDFETGLDRVRVNFITEHGQVKTIIVIQYEAHIDGKWRAIVRFDETHGFFHRDVMSPTGRQQKIPMIRSDKSLALNEAIAEIKQFWRAYRKAYEDEYYASE